MSIPEHSVDVSPIEAQSPPFIATSNLWSPEQSSCSYRDVVRRKEPPLDWSGAGLALAAIPVDARATARSSLSSSSTPVFTRISNPDQSSEQTGTVSTDKPKPNSRGGRHTMQLRPRKRLNYRMMNLRGLDADG
ncbi:hypothetical protein FOZ62_015820 [Perkinsus olseni]|nr:hypothetical protein FOZ62_015820 [Perkinsus olseni]